MLESIVEAEVFLARVFVAGVFVGVFLAGVFVGVFLARVFGATSY